MLDPRLLREDFEAVKAKLKTRAVPDNFDSFPEYDRKRRTLQVELEGLRGSKNKLGPDIAKAKKDGTDVSALLQQLKDAGERETELGREIADLEQYLDGLQLIVPNIPHESVPVGTSESDNRLEKTWGEKRQFDFKPQAHWDIAEALDIVDFERAAQLSGARFAVYKGDGARLERALINFMLEHHHARGYTEIIPPLLVRRETMIGSGQLPKFEGEAFRTDSGTQPLYLIPTSEVALCNMHVDEILDASQLPIYYTSYTPCFRAEAGSHGRDVRGLIRLHQFNKVELVKLTSPDTSYEELEKLTRDAESILETLQLPYRRMTLCTGDMGIASSKTHDLEVWLPGQDQYREISSCSNTSDYQARRTKTRFRRAAGDKPEFVHMLNGSGLAVGRTFLAILENYQQADGSVIIPEALRPYMNNQSKIESKIENK